MIVFGRAGAGKSSVINMLDGKDTAKLDDGLRGVTSHSVAYKKTIKRQTFTIFDTAGANPGLGGIAFAQDANNQLRRLIEQLSGGVSLLVCVVREPLTQSDSKAYKLLFQTLCEKEVPIVVVITCLEELEDMDQWWTLNRSVFDGYGMVFKAFACITSTRGALRNGVHVYEREYGASKTKVEDLISDHHMRNPWVKPADVWSRLVSSRLQIPKNEHSPNTVRNIIVFGGTGAGKSSVINMLDGDHPAPVSNQTKGVTFESTRYKKKIGGHDFTVFDTAGLNEGKNGTVPAKDAIEQLYKLIRQLSDGISLLVYVMKGPRINDSAADNYTLFHEVFCKKNIPIVIVITHLEQVEDTDQWWMNARPTFDEYKMFFESSACITATKGKCRNGVHLLEDEYVASKKKVEDLILAHFMQDPWVMPTQGWVDSIMSRIRRILAKYFRLEPTGLSRTLYEALQKFGGLSEEAAWARAYQL